MSLIVPMDTASPLTGCATALMIAETTVMKTTVFHVLLYVLVLKLVCIIRLTLDSLTEVRASCISL